MLAKKCLLVGIFTLLSVSLAIAAPPAVHPTTGEPLVIDCLRGTPDAIDGDLSDWNLEAMTPAVLDVVEQLNSGQATWDGPEDCSGEFYLLWDDENIYIAAVVKDEKLSMNKSGGDIWNADAIEVFFSTLNAVAGHDEHYQYGFNANNQRWNWCNMDGAGSTEPDYLQIASSVTADGYICEASIPYGQMLSLDFSAGNTIGFHPVFDDTDNGDTELQMTWTGREAHDQSLGFGHLFLSAEPPAALPEGWQSQDIGTTGGSAAESDGTWAISADGADIWGSSDEFHYAYMPLSGDGTIIAQVVDNGTGSNGWAKGGVMIRETLDQGSKHAIMALTGGEGGGIAFQGRPETDGSSWGLQGDITASLPHWVKLTREGNTITGYHSADGVEWALMTDTSPDGDMTDPIDIEMATDVYIGLFATSHASGEIRTYTFDNVSIELPIPVTDPDLLIYYDFESGAGEMAIDRSGHKNHGLFMGNPEWATGIFGGCVAIDIADLDYIETVAPLNIVSNTVTVTGWVKHDETPAAWSGILTHRGTSPGCLGLQHDGTELRYMWGADVYWSFSSGLLIPNGEWYFAALAISPDQGKLYLNGIEQTATNVAPHEPTNFDSLIRVGRDHNDDRIMTSLIDEVRFYNRTLTDVDIQRLLLSDVTAPGDNVVGVPNDGDWPGAETPDLAIDDDTSTKYLHFKGETETTGFQVTPAAGPSTVTGLTFTTANDAVERDPVAFELSGSNESIDGPYELIASGDIVDFVQADACPRFTMNATPISFDNDVAYAHYQVLFPAVRDAASANSMQIAEVELLGVKPAAANIILVSGNHDFDLDGVVDDFMLRDILEAEGHTVDYQPGNWTELDDDKIAALNAADLVIISRTTNSGDYAADDTEIAQWNSITTPMLSSSTHLVRSSRWKWADSTSLLDLAPAVMELADGTQVQAMDEAVGLSSFIDAAPGNGTVLATGDGLPWIIEWEAGVEYYDGAGQTAGGPRVFFVAGTQELEGVSNWGEWNLTPEGNVIFLNTVNSMLTAGSVEP